MKKRLSAIAAVFLAVSMLLTGCSSDVPDYNEETEETEYESVEAETEETAEAEPEQPKPDYPEIPDEKPSTDLQHGL